MNLEKYIYEELQWSIRKYASHSKISYMSLLNLINGRDVRGRILVHVARASKGNCTAEEIYEEYVEKPREMKKEIEKLK